MAPQSTARQKQSVNVKGRNAEGRESDRHGGADDGYLTGGDGRNGILVLRGSGRHLVEVGDARERLAIDGRNLRGSGAIDRDENDATGRGAVLAGVDDDILNAGGTGLN